MSGMRTKGFLHILQRATKPKASILPKQTPEDIVLCIYIRIVKIVFEEVETMVLYPLRVGIRLNGRIFLLSLDFTPAQVHETQI